MTLKISAERSVSYDEISTLLSACTDNFTFLEMYGIENMQISRK